MSNHTEHARAKLLAAAKALNEAAQALDALPAGQYALDPENVAWNLRLLADTTIARSICVLAGQQLPESMHVSELRKRAGIDAA